MKISTTRPVNEPRTAGTLFAELEAAGYDGAYSFESSHDAFLPLAALIGVMFWLVEPERLFELPREKPRLWITIMVLYPLVSAYPQELLFRTFLFQRYRPILGEGWAMILFSGLTFGLAHVVLANWVAVLLSTCGGLLFAWTYARSKSTLMAALEHGLWGDFVFAIGLGWWFYGGYVMN